MSSNVKLLVDFPGYAPVVAEVQILYRPILELKVRPLDCCGVAD